MDRFMKEKQAFMLRRREPNPYLSSIQFKIEKKRLCGQQKKERLWSEELLLRNREE